MKVLERKSDHIKVLEYNLNDAKQLAKGLQCQNCKERHYFTITPLDTNRAFCTNCGHSTPLRQIKHGRGLTAPSIQQDTAIVQNKNPNVAHRKPRGIHDNKRSELEQDLISKGFEVIDSQTIEPSR